MDESEKKNDCCGRWCHYMLYPIVICYLVGDSIYSCCKRMCKDYDPHGIKEFLRYMEERHRKKSDEEDEVEEDELP